MLKEILHTQDWKLKTGLIITISFSTFTGFANIGVLYLLGIPILCILIGIILIWFSKTNIKIKLLLSLLPIPIILLSLSLYITLLPRAEPERFLIPQNFRGQFAIVFNEKCGQALVYENSKRIYNIPENGILILKSERTLSGVIDRRFYLIDDNGKPTEIIQLHQSKFEEEQKDWHWMFSRIKLSKDLVGVFWAYRNDLSFIISDYNSLEQESKESREQKQKIFQNNLDIILKECHKSL